MRHTGNSMEVPSRYRPIRFSAFEVDVRAGELRKHGLKVKLQKQPFEVLAMLLKHPGEVVMREELRQKLWPGNTFVDFDVGLNTAIKKLRHALEDSAETPRFVETLPGRGYRFILPTNEAYDESSRDSAIPRGGAATLEKQAVAPNEQATAEPASLGVRRGWRTPWIIAVALIALLAGFVLDVGGLRKRLVEGLAPAPIQSIAVLPLENLSGDASQEYFVDGVTDALTTELAQIRALRVVSRTSVMRYKETKKPLPEIARELNVDAVVEGAVVRSGERVRLTAQLIHARTDRHLWAESYERDLRDILALQSEVARAIANKIRVQVTPQEQTHLAQARSVNTEAYTTYLKGRYFWNQRTEEKLRKAIEYFEDAIKKDANFAPAYSGLADSYGLFGFSQYAALPPTEAERRAEAAARKALELDDTLAEAHTALGSIQHRSKWNWVEAEREFRRAVELNPNYSPAYQFYALYLSSMGRQQEALDAIRRALELEPASPIINAAAARQLIFARQYDLAIEQLQKALELEPNFMVAHVRLGLVYERKGIYENAVAELGKARTLSQDNPFVIAALGHAYSLSGNRKRAQELLAELKQLSKKRYVSGYDMAVIYCGLREPEQAFAWLEKAYQDREGSLVYLKVEPWLDPIRADPRFAQLVRRVGLPP
jgi:TolB-like protein/DNA-binding winged helix-turn-helix (wHTH) protein/Flp pilus assembly protein TadD